MTRLLMRSMLTLSLATATKYHGEQAVDQAIEYYGTAREDVPEHAIHLILHEGFVPGVYTDTKGIETEGVGLTGDFIGQDFFTEVLPVFEARARRITPEWDTLPQNTKNAIISAVYRGDLKPTHKTAEHIRNREWEAASIEYLNNRDYLNSKAKNDKAGKVVHGVQARMEENARAFIKTEQSK